MKREAVKYIRDAAKSAYEKASQCEITGDTENLELHHYFSVSQLYHNWIKKKGYSSTDVLSHRDEFIEEHKKELYEEVVTLRKDWHFKLHQIYGTRPSLATGPKQKRWVQKKKEQHVKETS